jgi:long-subunit acyl-CoA synthetase (AMP-forming)
MSDLEVEGKERYDSGELQYEGDQDNIVFTEPMDLFSIIYTSGSTGQPKGTITISISISIIGIGIIITCAAIPVAQFT